MNNEYNESDIAPEGVWAIPSNDQFQFRQATDWNSVRTSRKTQQQFLLIICKVVHDFPEVPGTQNTTVAFSLISTLVAHIITSSPGTVANCNDRVCSCVFVCPRAYLWNCTYDQCYPWTWLGPPLAALRYVTYIRFYECRHICRSQWPSG